MKLTFLRQQPRADNIISFFFERPADFDYKPGQFGTFNLPHERPDDRGAQRWFTLCSSPSENELMITTKFSQPSSTFKQALRALEPGDTLEMSGTEGDFTLPAKPGRELVLVAGGIGVTPYRSMIKYLSDRGDNPYRLHLLYAANSPGELAFRDLFDGGLPKLKVTYLVRESSDDWQGETGILSAKKIDELARGIMNKVVYLSGPEPMVESLDKQLKDAGQLEDLIKTDYFPNYKQY